MEGVEIGMVTNGKYGQGSGMMKGWKGRKRMRRDVKDRKGWDDSDRKGWGRQGIGRDEKGWEILEDWDEREGSGSRNVGKGR